MNQMNLLDRIIESVLRWIIGRSGRPVEEIDAEIRSRELEREQQAIGKRLD